MDSLNALETAALRRIAEQYPDDEPELLRLFRSLVVTKRQNTGGGFFTHIAPDSEKFPPVSLRSPSGDVRFGIEGLQYGIECLVFLTDGYPTLLEGYALGPEDTSKIDFGTVNFTSLPARSDP